MHEIVIIETPSLGDRSYVVHDGELAIVIDPQRDIDRVEDVTAGLGVRIGLVAETHIHNDYVTGGYALAQKVGSPYVVAADDAVDFDRLAAHDGDHFDVGHLTLTAVATPGHTPNHLSYVLAEDRGRPEAVFTGGSMLFGAVGRTDLTGEERTEQLTRAQYHSVRRLAEGLADDVDVRPTHGFGSFCSAGPTTDGDGTLRDQRRQNTALTTDDEEAFVAQLIRGLGAIPRYYRHMGPANSGGPAAPDLRCPPVVDATELRRRIDAREWVVDLRNRVAFAGGHVAGTISVEVGPAFATHVGWTMPWGTALNLIGDRADQVAEAQRELVRIGVDRISGQAAGDVAALAAGRLRAYRVADFVALGQAWVKDRIVVLDVRRPDEWAAGHLPGAAHIPLWDLELRMAEIPDGEIWVHCASGFRASIAASLLERGGRDVVYVDDDWSRARTAGLPIEI